MSDQSIDRAADAATGTDADQGEGQGVATPGAAGTMTGPPGGSGDQPVPGDERGGADEAVEGATAGERSLRAAEVNRPD